MSNRSGHLIILNIDEFQSKILLDKGSDILTPRNLLRMEFYRYVDS